MSTLRVNTINDLSGSGSSITASNLKTNTIQNSSGTTALNIDSIGRVTTPNNPAFEAIRVSGTVGNQYAANQEIVFDGVNLNIGNGYNASTGRFTAPVSGKYVFKMFGMTQGTSSYNIKKNGVNLTYLSNSYATAYANAHWAQASTTSIIYLNVGDYASVFISAIGTGIYAAGNNHNLFCGYLLS
jgi:hypothetical protein